MRILYYFKEQDTPMYQWQRIHILNELKYHDCKIHIFNPLNYKCIEDANENLLLHLSENKYDLFMTPHNQETLYVDTLELIKKKGIPTLLICFDNLLIPFYHKKIAPIFDLVWLTSMETAKIFEKWGVNYIFLPYAANPFYFKPDRNEELPSVGFIGTPYGSRTKRINAMIEKGIPVSLHANLPQNLGNVSKFNKVDLIKDVITYSKFSIGRKVMLGNLASKVQKRNELHIENDNLTILPRADTFNDMYELFSKYALSLSTTDARSTGVLKNPVQVVNLRSFEIPMAGGLQICSYSNELAQYFEEDKEIIFYKNDYELEEKARFYLDEKNTRLRMEMKIAARIKAENEHTWFSRFKYIFDYFHLK